MINILLFNNNSGLNAALQHQCAGSETIQVITPNPVIADIARTKFEGIHPKLETQTISNFLKSNLKALIENERLENFQGKSELNILLGSLWKMGRPDSSYELFKRSFQMLTDFRSFSMNEEVLKTILEEYDEELAGAVFWFHKLMMEMDIIDEHRSYFLLSERLRAGDLPPLYETGKTYIFWGFDFLTASQVDLLNAMSIREEVIVPFYQTAFEKSKDLDWIKWLSKTEANIIQATEEEKSTDIEKIKLIPFSKNYLAKTLKSLQTEKEFKDKKINYILGTKNLSLEFISELSVSEISYKVPVDLYAEKVGYIKDFLFEHLMIRKEMNTDEVISLLQEESSEVLEKFDYRLFKVISLTLEQIIKWNSLSENNETLGEFDLLIIMDSVKLNVPRNSLFSGSKDSIELKSLKNIDKSEECDLSILSITSDYGPVKGSVVQYSENVEKYLASIGPIRRSELEFLQLKAKIHEFLETSNTYVLIEDGILEHDLGWSNIITEDKREILSIEQLNSPTREYVLIQETKNSNLTSISATKLQSFSDCPRKYYFKYVDKKSPRIEVPLQLNLMQLGLIEHEVIENYLKNNTAFEEEKLLVLIKKTLKDFQKKHPFSDDLFEEYQLEIIAFTTNIIKELLVLNKEIGLELRCEVPLPSNEELDILGSIDCLGKNSDTLVILDFKRGGGSIPSQIGLKEYKKIQLWFYLERMKKNQLYSDSTKLIWGYINLSALEDSLVYSNDEVLIEKFNQLDLKAFKKMNYFDGELCEKLEGYSEYEAELINSLRNEKSFLPRPVDSKACTYCDLSNICPRGEI